MDVTIDAAHKEKRSPIYGLFRQDFNVVLAANKHRRAGPCSGRAAVVQVTHRIRHQKTPCFSTTNLQLSDLCAGRSCARVCVRFTPWLPDQ